MTKIDPGFEARLRQHPQEMVRVIIRITSESPSIEVRLQELGAKMLYRFSLLRAVVVSCTAEAALALSQEPWVEAIEEDRQVFSQPCCSESPGTGGNDE